MSLKKGGGPETLPATLTITGQGSTDKLAVTYHNRKSSEVEGRVSDSVTAAGIIPFLVKEWDTDFSLTEDGAKEFEDEYPGITQAIVSGFWKARRKEVEKN